MKSASMINGLLWVANIVIGAGIIVFAFQYLLFPAESDALEDIDFIDPERMLRKRQNPPGYANLASLRSMRNPIVKPVGGAGGGDAIPSSLQGLTLIGTIRDEKNDPKRGIAIIQIDARKIQVPAYVGEEIVDNGGKPVPELRGWKVIEVYSSHVVFFNGTTRAQLRKSTPSSPTARGSRKGPRGKYDPRNYKSRLLSQNANKQVWLIDPNEADYAFANTDALLTTDISLSAYPAGGVKIESINSGSMPAMRGLKSGDVIKTVNGRAVNSLADAKSLMQSGRFKKQNRLILNVQRLGRTITFEYRMGKRW